jgi:uncharacterized membrane protein
MGNISLLMEVRALVVQERLGQMLLQTQGQQ